jgi:RNA polymerase sigma factor (sigma-70 family)
MSHVRRVDSGKSSTDGEGDNTPKRVAIEGLLQRQLEPLRRWAHRRLPLWARSISDTTDLVHDAIVHTLNRIGSIRVSNDGAIGAYLRQAINNRLADEFRRLKRRGVAYELIDEFRSASPDPFEEAVGDELEHRYRCAVHRLKESDRFLVVGHVELEYSIEQLACSTNRTVRATRMALRRALERLASQMQRHE